MKLELKYLAPYLPYKLKVQTEHIEGNRIYTLEGLSAKYDRVDLDDDYGWSYIGGIKPILRPLSDLTKEINLHDNFFAIPIENMTGYKLEGNISDAPTTVQHLYKCSKGEIEAKFLDYWVIVQLLEWHFDIFNLIKNNLAIDINTINTIK